MFDIRLVIESDWDSIMGIYEEGINTGNATFQTEAPPKDQWFSSYIPECTIVCIGPDAIVGWASLSRVSSRLSSATLIDGEFGTANDGGFLFSSPTWLRRSDIA